MRTKLVLCAFLLSILQARADEYTALQLSELNSRGHLFGASAMLYFNPQERTPDPRLLNSVFDHLRKLQTNVEQLGQPVELAKPVQDLQELFKQLDSMPPEQRKRYPDLVRQLLVHLQKLQKAADAAYASEQLTYPADSSAALFADQSRALASVLFDYQLRHYPVLDKERFQMSPEELQALNQSIEDRFDQLRDLHAEHSGSLDEIRRNYLFVRGQLQQSKSRANSGPEFYVSRVVTDLEELAMTVARSPH